MEEADLSGGDLDDESAVQDLWDRLGKLSGRDKDTFQRKSLGMFATSTDGTRPRSSSASMPPNQGQVLPSVSRITVETSTKKLKPFSGRSRISNGEVDYKHWRRAALRVVEDSDLNEGQKKNLLLQSLTGIAEDSVDLHRHLHSADLLEVLDKCFRTTVDSSDLLADFFQILQLPTQSVSEYLNALYVHLAEVVTLGGLAMEELPRTLLKQLVRGINVSDDYLIAKLRLDEKFDNPPNFPDLFVSVRREESRRTERKLRHKKLARTQSQVTTAPVSDAAVAEPTPSRAVFSPPPKPTLSGLDSLKEEMARIQQQLSALTAESKISEASRSGFCYKCGLDGHFVPACRNPANKALVSARKQGTKPLN